MLKFFSHLIIYVIILTATYFGASYYLERDMLSTSGQQQAPMLNLKKLDAQAEEMVTFRALEGKRTIVYFFAPWCSICHASISNLETVYKDADGKINAVAIALDYKTEDEVREFVAEKNLTMPVGLGNGMVADLFRVSAFPTYYVLDEKLNIIARSRGYTTEMGMLLRI